MPHRSSTRGQMEEYWNKRRDKEKKVHRKKNARMKTTHKKTMKNTEIRMKIESFIKW
jgi:hypothetical protein